MSFSRSFKPKSNYSLEQGTYHLDAEIKKLDRLIRKNNNMREQIMERASDLEEERSILSSPTRRVQELRSTCLALQDENEMLKYKRTLRKRLRSRVRDARSASLASWKANGGRGKTRDLTLAHAKILALQSECEELQSTHLDALRDGLNASISTSEAIMTLKLMTDKAEMEKEKRLSVETQCQRLRSANVDLQARVEALHVQVSAMENRAEHARVQEVKLKTSEQLLRKSAQVEHSAATHLKQRLLQAQSDAEESQSRERKLRIHIAGIAASGVGVDISAYGPYLDPYTNAYNFSPTVNAYNLSPTARRYYLDNIAATNGFYPTSPGATSPAVKMAAAAAVARQIDRDLEMATAVDRDVDTMRRARDRERLAILRSEADLGLSSSSSEIVERTLLESRMEVDAALGSSRGSYLSSDVRVRDL